MKIGWKKYGIGWPTKHNYQSKVIGSLMGIDVKPESLFCALQWNSTQTSRFDYWVLNYPNLYQLPVRILWQRNLDTMRNWQLLDHTHYDMSGHSLIWPVQGRYFWSRKVYRYIDSPNNSFRFKCKYLQFCSDFERHRKYLGKTEESFHPYPWTKWDCSISGMFQKCFSF